MADRSLHFIVINSPEEEEDDEKEEVGIAYAHELLGGSWLVRFLDVYLIRHIYYLRLVKYNSVPEKRLKRDDEDGDEMSRATKIYPNLFVIFKMVNFL